MTPARRSLLVVALLLAACGGGDDDEAAAPTTTTTTAAPTTTTAGPTTTTTTAPAEHYPDHAGDLYAGTTNWLCHPDLADDECDDLATTVVAADGSQTVDEAAPATDPAIDCFYVYPTVSSDPGAVADLEPGDEERSTTRAQFARYSTVCRTFAPVYRQITLNGLGGVEVTAEDRELAYGDVLDAWRTYVDELGDGRPVVVIGHSQGSGHLNRLLREEIAPDAAQRALLLSAMLLGSSVAEIPDIPPCAAADDTGCLVTFSSYPADSPPAEGSLFGRIRGTDEPALCVDPVALVGGDGLGDAVAPTTATLVGRNPDLEAFGTPYVSLPGAFRTSCEEANGYRFLAVGRADPADVRPLDSFLVQLLGPTWGLHLFDANLVQDDLIELVGRQARTIG